MKLTPGKKYLTRNGTIVTIQEPSAHSPNEIQGECLIGGYEVWVLPYALDGSHADPGMSITSELDLHIALEDCALSADKTERIGNALEEIVAQFNEAYTDWSTKTGCRANFEWRFDEKGAKFMGIKDIDANIYKKPLPTWLPKNKV